MLHRVLRNIGLALILLPEPFTTPLGLVLFGAACIFGRSSRVDSSHYLRGLITHYLNDARPFGPTGKIIQYKLKTSLPDSEWYAPPEKDVRNNIDNSRLLLRFGDMMGVTVFPAAEKIVHHSLSQRWAGFVWSGTSAVIAVEKPVNHAIDSSRLSLRYSIPEGRIPVAEKVIYHSLKRSLSGYVLTSEPVLAEETVRHCLNNDRLLQYYRKTMSRNLDKTKLRLALGRAN